ncbi:hypothetical protein J4441_01930 [Candidatus Micrarchaeota archaeon]|nr:hypothetical protein [Candidatus Micrarchaeota archaeon]
MLVEAIASANGTAKASGAVALASTGSNGMQVRGKGIIETPAELRSYRIRRLVQKVYEMAQEANNNGIGMGQREKHEVVNALMLLVEGNRQPYEGLSSVESFALCRMCIGRNGFGEWRIYCDQMKKGPQFIDALDAIIAGLDENGKNKARKVVFGKDMCASHDQHEEMREARLLGLHSGAGVGEGTGIF